MYVHFNAMHLVNAEHRITTVWLYGKNFSCKEKKEEIAPLWQKNIAKPKDPKIYVIHY